uniref:C-type lectin domain-containing protein n=1 Tax=Gadus morhua TaxID=8049 RepID=A0A8C5A444_GADMO
LFIFHDHHLPPSTIKLKNVTEQRDLLTLCNQECPRYWNKFGCKCYFNVLGSWNKSRKLCVSRGADLVVVDSKEEMDFISRYGGTIWLGATDEASEGVWRWVDGTVLSVDNPSWSGGKPDGGKEKNCLKSIGEETNLKWTDESCEDNRYGLFAAPFSTSLLHSSGVMRAQVALIVAFSSSALLGLASRIFRFTIPHRFSMGLRSGKFAGQSRRGIPWSLNQVLVDLALCAGAKSCWKMKSSPP